MAKSVMMYTSPTCAWCHKTKEFFAKHKVKFTEKSIIDEKNANEAQEKSGQIGVPVIEIDGKIIVGFDEPALRKALKIK